MDIKNKPNDYQSGKKSDKQGPTIYIAQGTIFNILE